MNKFDKIYSIITDHEKRISDLNIRLDNSEKQINEYERKFQKYNTVIKQLKSRVDNNEKYLSALIFVCQFSWSLIDNNILKEEAKDKFVDDLDKETLDNYVDIDSLDKDPESNFTVKANNYTDCFCTVPYCDSSISRISEIDSINIGDLNIKLNKKDEEKPQRLRVKNVVYNPFKYSKEQIYAVYKYLKTIIEKDSNLSKYIG